VKKVFVVVGLGPAGAEACSLLRSKDPDAEIIVFQEEPYPFYSRIRLTEYLGGQLDARKLVMKDDNWFKDARITLYKGEKVEGIDAKEGICFSSQRKVRYDALLLATGATAFKPPIKGADLENCFTLRTLDDANAILSVAKGAKKVAIIGGGILGLECALGLKKLGLHCVVIEVAPYLLSRQLDASAGKFLQGILENKGLEFRLGCTTNEILGDGKVRGVYLSNGEAIEVSFAVIAAGIRPRTDLALALGASVSKGIVVDDHMKTSVEGVFAAGDCAEHKGKVYGIWPSAEAQGRVAAGNMAGTEATFEGIVPSNTMKVSDVPVFSIGALDGEKIVVLQKEVIFRRFVYDESDRLVGAILIGTLKERQKVVNAITQKQGYEPTEV